LPDGGSIPLRATHEKGEGDMSGARVAATIAASPVLVWVKGKDVAFDKGTETSAYVSGDVHIDERQLRGGSASTAADSADRDTGTRLLNNAVSFRCRRRDSPKRWSDQSDRRASCNQPTGLDSVERGRGKRSVINLMVRNRA
jgi:hypothetical protein